MKWPILLCLACAAPAQARSVKAGAITKLWTEWYLVTRNGEALSLFEETAERRPGEQELAITQKWVEKSGARQETYIGSVSEEQSLAPVAFFVERKGRKHYKIDGRAKGKQLEITFKPGAPGAARTTESTPLGAGVYLSSALPTAIARHFKGAKKETLAFTAVVEDDSDMNVEVKKGTVEITAEEKKFGREGCRLARMGIDGASQEWWIAQNGKVCRVHYPDSGVTMELSTEKAAKKALKEPN